MIGYEDRYLKDRTAFWLGIKSLEQRKVLVITEPVKKELIKTQEYIMRSYKKDKLNETAKKLYEILMGITLGGRV